MTAFPCPSCGGTEWRGFYETPESQHVSLVADADGKIDHAETEYLGCPESYDPGGDTEYRCRNCEHVIPVFPPRVRLLHGRHEGREGTLVYEHPASGVYVVQIEFDGVSADNVYVLPPDLFERIAP